MTTIVGIQGDGWTVMAADSQITDGSSKIISPHTPKIIRFNDILIGLRGDARPGDIIAYNWRPPRIRNENPQDWVVRCMIPSMIQAFEKMGYKWNDEDADFNFLVSVKGELFDIGSDMSISRSVYNVYATGSGKDIAIGYLHGQNIDFYNLKAAQDAAHDAVDAATVYDIHTSHPIQVEIG